MAKISYAVFDRGTGSDVNGTLTTTSFTSEPIEVISEYWNLNVYFDAAVTGTPLLTVQASNSTNVDSFNDIECAVNVTLPNMLESLKSTYKYIRFVYDDNGASGGDKYFDLTFSNPTS